MPGLPDIRQSVRQPGSPVAWPGSVLIIPSRHASARYPALPGACLRALVCIQLAGWLTWAPVSGGFVTYLFYWVFGGFAEPRCLQRVTIDLLPFADRNLHAAGPAGPIQACLRRYRGSMKWQP